MADSDTRHEQEVDNWFDEPDTSGALEERSARLARSKQRASQSAAREDDADWISADATPTTGERLPAPVAGVLRRGRALPVAALIVVACLLGGLAAAGVFSGSNRKAPQAQTPTTSTTTTAPQTTQTQPALAAPATTLKPGDQGAAVKVLQRALAHLGYSPGTIDGQYGPSTIRAVSRFQRANGLKADGILGPKTLRALTRALRTG